jgi:hypothetical protein
MKTPTTASNNGNNASFVNHGRYFGSLLCLVIMSWSSVFQMWEVENLVCSEWEGLPVCSIDLVDREGPGVCWLSTAFKATGIWRTID